MFMNLVRTVDQKARKEFFSVVTASQATEELQLPRKLA